MKSKKKCRESRDKAQAGQRQKHINAKLVRDLDNALILQKEVEKAVRLARDAAIANGLITDGKFNPIISKTWEGAKRKIYVKKYIPRKGQKKQFNSINYVKHGKAIELRGECILIVQGRRPDQVLTGGGLRDTQICAETTATPAFNGIRYKRRAAK